jgi:CubicO group peptidase (beta-lactamase class C family)
MRPLGMNDTRYEVRDAPRERTAVGYRWENDRWTAEPVMPHGVFGAMGGVQTSAEDYSRWIAFLLSAWPARDGDDAGPVRRSTVREMAQGLNFISTTQRPRGEEMCTIASAYGMGLRVLQDCALGLVLTHGGGYPGYGSTMILLPEQGVGIFAFANRTYAGPAPPATAALQAMHDAGLLTGRAWPVSDALANAYRAAGAMYAAGDLAPGRDALAMNFLMDRSAENWRREFARLKGEVGECQTDAPIAATGALAGRIAWTCERGTIAGTLLLAPTNPPGIQALRLNARRAE